MLDFEKSKNSKITDELNKVRGENQRLTKDKVVKPEDSEIEIIGEQLGPGSNSIEDYGHHLIQKLSRAWCNICNENRSLKDKNRRLIEERRNQSWRREPEDQVSQNILINPFPAEVKEEPSSPGHPVSTQIDQ